MTSSRVIRGTKAKIFLYVCAVIVITGLIACYNTTLTQLDEVKNSNLVCHQQQENLSTQLQVISDYKQKLEKNLKNEKAEHQQSKSNWESKMNEEKARTQKLTNDAILKYNSLQQHYQLLQIKYDDFKEESSSSQKKQLEEINSLQSKLKEIEEELKKVKSSKENIKTQLIEMELENAELTKAVQKNHINETIKFYVDEHDAIYAKYTALKEKCGEHSQENPAKVADLANKPSEKALLNLPGLKMAENPSSSTKAVPKVSPSQGDLNGARPLLVPSVTPKSVKKKGNLKPPQGVVEPPDRENQNEQPQVQFEKKVEKDDIEKDNVAQEVFDAPQNNIEGGLAFHDDGFKADLNIDQKKDLVNDKKHEEQEYKDNQREEEGDDDLDDYDNHQARAEDIAVRN